MFWGQGPGLSLRQIGQTGGATTVSLLTTEMPAHNHLMQGTTGTADALVPNGATFGSATRFDPPFYAAQGTAVPTAPQAIGITGSGQPHNNMQPYLAVNFIIALQGIYPPRN